MNERRLLILHLLGVLATLSEVGILINGTRNQTRNRGNLFPVRTKDLRKTGSESSRGLGGTEVEFSNVVAVGEAESASHLVDGDPLGHATDVLIESTANKVKVTEDECLLHVESNSNDIPCIGFGEALGIVDLDLRGVHVLLVVGHHDNERYVEDILQPPVH